MQFFGGNIPQVRGKQTELYGQISKVDKIDNEAFRMY